MSDKPYMPSNGIEGIGFFESWCTWCARDLALNGTKPDDDCVPDDYCPIIAKSMDGIQPAEWIWRDGRPTCTAYIPSADAGKRRCEKTEDMFGGA